LKAALQREGSSIPAVSADWLSLRLEPTRDKRNATRISLSDSVLDDYLPEEPPLDPLVEPLLEEPLPEAPPVDEPLPAPDEPPVPNELPEDPLPDGLVEDPPEDDFSLEELRPDEEAPLPDELLSLLDEAPLEEEPFPLPAASTPSALAVLSSSRPVACIPLSFWKARRACCVFGPITPSAGPGSWPLLFSAS
jgi:hypothetical protein